MINSSLCMTAPCKCFVLLLATNLMAALSNAGQLDSELPRNHRAPRDDRDLVTKRIIRGHIVDADTEQPIPARVHVRDGNDRWYLCNSMGGTAVHYRKEPNYAPHSREVHTTLSAAPFSLELEPGEYEFRVERGKEYLPFVRSIEVNDGVEPLIFRLRRWTNMAEHGWYSGDTHVHRLGSELHNILLAEDLNVAFPLNYWVTVAGQSPGSSQKLASGDLVPEVVEVDDTHVIYPLNTEYEIFTANGRSHTLGAVFVLNHKSELTRGVPPVRPVAERARVEGALLDLDKHSWPWSLMLVPIMEIDLFELANNHLWQTRFGLPRWTREMAPAYMELETDEQGFTEWGWTDFGFQTYYALLNCGFRLRVSAGTASGVHPVQLGFGRVYVHLPGGFRYDRWIEGLNAGRSFVTTGPMLLVKFDGQHPGHTFEVNLETRHTVRLTGTAKSKRPLQRMEVVVAGRVQQCLPLRNTPTAQDGYENHIDTTIAVDTSSWIAVRCLEKHPKNRVRFAHTNPVHVDIAGEPMRPRKVECDYFVSRMKEEIARNQGILDEESLEEYRSALQIFQRISLSAE